MSSAISKKLMMILVPVVITGCSTTTAIDEEFLTKTQTLGSVRHEVKAKTGKQTVWVQNSNHAAGVAKRVHGMIHKKTINADTAVQVALLNNKDLQASYAAIGLSATQIWQQSLPENPTVSIEVLGIGAPGLGLLRSIEGYVSRDILRRLTHDKRVAIAETRFDQAKKQAVLETLRLAAQTRTAWINAVAAFETVTYLNQAQVAADASSELALKLGQSGAINKTAQAREHVFYAELTGQRAEAKLAAKTAKHQLTRLMGLWGSEVTYYVPDKLQALPKKRKKKRHVEAEALKQRVDLQVAKLELEALAKSYGLTEATRYLTDFEILSGAEIEREREEGEPGVNETVVGQVEIEFNIPIFDTGKARLRRAELNYMQAANRLAAMAVNVRSDARGAYAVYNARYDIARHYKRNVLPLRNIIEEQSLLTNNGMINSTFDLLQDTRGRLNSLILSAGAKREFWLADAGLTAAILSGAGGASGEAGEITISDGGGAGH